MTRPILKAALAIAGAKWMDRGDAIRIAGLILMISSG